jgi:hypothetical protein
VPTAADQLAAWLKQPDLPADPLTGDPFGHVLPQLAEIIAFATAMRNTPRSEWKDHELATLDRMYRELAGRADRTKVVAISVVDDWLKQRQTADPAALLRDLEAGDSRFARLPLAPEELRMLRESDFEATRVTAALALRRGALGFPEVDSPLAAGYASALDQAFNALKAAKKRFRPTTP